MAVNMITTAVLSIALVVASADPCPILPDAEVLTQELAGKTLRFQGITPSVRRSESNVAGPELRLIAYSAKPEMIVDGDAVTVSMAACPQAATSNSTTVDSSSSRLLPAAWLASGLAYFLSLHLGAKPASSALLALALAGTAPLVLGAEHVAPCDAVLEVEIVTPKSECAICMTGCAPYSPVQDWIPTLQNMAESCELMVHVGDTIAGSAVCNATTMAPPLDAFKSQGIPALYTLGDNENNDCHRRASQGIPAEIYKATDARRWHVENYGIGGGKDLTGMLDVDAQSDACPFNQYVEKCDAAVVTLEVPGTQWYLGDERAKYADQDTVDPLDDRVVLYTTTRDCALAWLDSSVEKAKAAGLHAMLIFYHASFWESSAAQLGSKDDFGSTLYGGSVYDSPEANSATGGENPYNALKEKLLQIAADNPDITFYTGHADHHYWKMQSPMKQDNYVNVMVEGSSRAMVSYAKFIIDSEDAANPVTLKKVQVPSPTA